MSLTDGLGALAPLSGEPGDIDISVHSVSTSAGEMTYATYTAPVDFVRPDAPGDAGGRSRVVTIECWFVPDEGGADSFHAFRTIQILRPPVIMCHGVWSGPSTWRFSRVLHDWRWQVTQVDYSSRNYVPFSGCVGAVELAIAQARAAFRAQGYVCGQVDYVAHSMGGLLGRLHASKSDYLCDDNLGEGDFHKFITLDSPHQGARLASIIVAMRNIVNDPGSFWGTRLLYSEILTFFAKAWGLDYARITGGAVDDLSEYSNAILDLAPLKAPTHVHVGTGGSDITGAATRLASEARMLDALPEARLLLWLVELAGYSVNSVVGDGQHDFIVPRSSQQAGIVGAAVSSTSWLDGIHTRVTGSNSVGAIVENLLQAPVESDLFAPQFTQSTLLASGIAQREPLTLGAAHSSIADGGLGIRILSPVDGATVHPGEAVHVQVTGIGGRPLAKVAVVAGDSALFLVEPAFDDSLRVPDSAVGPLKLETFGLLTDSSLVVGQPVVVQVVPADTLVWMQISSSGIDEVTDVVNLSALGETSSLRAIGIYCHDPGPDFINFGCISPEVRLDITEIPGLTWASDDPAVVAVGRDGHVVAVGAGAAKVTASYSSFTASTYVMSQGSARLRNLPRASAGGPYFGRPGMQVSLEARQSTDPDTLFGDHLHFAWDLDGDGNYDDADSVEARMASEAPGNYLIGLLVRNDAGDSSLTRTTLTVSDSAQVVGVRTPWEPAVKLTLRVMPNPSTTGGLTLELSLPQRGPARLEVFDVSGRRVAGRDLSEQPPGRQTIQLGGQQVFAPGVYIVRLTQGARRTTARAVILH